jgi:chromosome segregation ATPase
MSILSRIPNFLPSTPTSAPQDAMIASQKTHIDELVQKTRTLDNTIKHLQEQLSNSRGEWQADRKEWVDGCDSLLACYRIAHLRTNVLLAQERVTLAHERDVTHRERIAVIQRDYNLILFKAREKELELEADRLKEQLRGAANGNETLVAELRGKLAAGMRELKERAALLRDAEKAREEAEVRRSTLPPSYAYMVFSFSSGTDHARSH